MVTLRWRKADPSVGGREKPSRRPSDTPFLQQSMKAWRPIYNHRTSVQILLLIGIVFIPLSGLLLSKNAEVREARYDYTKCHEISLQDELETMPRENFDEYFKGSTVGQPVVQWMRSERPRTFDKVTKNYTTCIIEFFLPEDLQPPIHLYYHLTNFNQNHRKYGTSFSKSQLAGKNVSLSSLEDSCKPVSAAGGEKNGSQKIVYPCGVIANSVFNDTFENPRRFVDTFKKSSSRSVPYKMTKSNIASLIDRQLFKPSSYTVSDKAGANDSLIVPPPNWIERYPRGYHKDNMFNPAEDEAFMVWMRTAASPTFAKLAMRNDDQPMLRGLYRLEVFSYYPIHKNGGKKSIIITTVPPGFGCSKFLATAYATTGAISILLALFVALSTIWKPRPLKDHEYLHRGIGVY